MLREAIMDSCEVCQCTSLFKNAFRIKNTPESVINSKPKSRRLLGMASRRFSSPETVSPSINKENGTIGRNCHNSSPQKIAGSKRLRCPLEDCDSNSQDSGYGASYHERDSRDGFQFAEPLGVAPRRMSVESRSPMQSPVRSSPHRQRSIRPSIFRSLSSGYESMDDGFNDLIDIDTLDDATLLPNGITSLLSGNIVGSDMKMECDITTTPEFARTKTTRPLRRSLSLQNESTEKRHPTTPQSSLSKVRSCLFRSPTATCSTAELSFDDNTRNSHYSIVDSPPLRSFKRPGPPSEASPKLVKRSRKSASFQNIPDEVDSAILPRPAVPIVAEIGLKLVKKSRKSNSFQDIPEEIESCCPVLSVKPSLQRSFSETEAHAIIKSAIHRSTTDADLTGDFSKPCILPLAEGRHEDLKSISADTLAGLMRGDFDNHIDSFTIVDCRYPYEYDGGHIQGALNLYSKDLIEQHLLDPLTHAPRIQPDSSKRSILVFHCEFSWERGPNLSRFLRNIDRQRNKEHYPALHYPEVYLLHGGYEQFYKEQRDLCSPQGYRPMRDPNHEADLRQFRSKSKSWQGDRPLGDKPKVNLTARTNLKRLGF
ncbi:hypothetical protein KPH14_004167 [Odynerus spinipes]|uniref:protein-tyrosine-phosphatase n=1 Tax=Odynerus spinipes TaxID=1348599 RepID=A0AAD9VW36_9HYME|nr:hypothetical protein KPH14_004167 [Odynerus spinipes]